MDVNVNEAILNMLVSLLAKFYSFSLPYKFWNPELLYFNFPSHKISDRPAYTIVAVN